MKKRIFFAICFGILTAELTAHIPVETFGLQYFLIIIAMNTVGNVIYALCKDD